MAGENYLFVIQKAFKAFKQFMQELVSIKKERDMLVKEALEKAKQKKIKTVQSQIKRIQ